MYLLLETLISYSAVLTTAILLPTQVQSSVVFLSLWVFEDMLHFSWLHTETESISTQYSTTFFKIHAHHFCQNRGRTHHLFLPHHQWVFYASDTILLLFRSFFLPPTLLSLTDSFKSDLSFHPLSLNESNLNRSAYFDIVFARHENVLSLIQSRTTHCYGSVKQSKKCSSTSNL